MQLNIFHAFIGGHLWIFGNYLFPPFAYFFLGTFSFLFVSALYICGTQTLCKHCGRLLHFALHLSSGVDPHSSDTSDLLTCFGSLSSVLIQYSHFLEPFRARIVIRRHIIISVCRALTSCAVWAPVYDPDVAGMSPTLAD